MSVPNPARITPNMARKGRRLHAEGKVHYAGLTPLYVVEGDHDVYAVIVQGDAMTCTCPHHGTCSHIAAVHRETHQATVPPPV